MDAFFERFVPVAALFFGIAAVSAVCNFASVRFAARMTCNFDIWLAARLLYEFEHAAASLLPKSVFAQRPTSRCRLDRRPQRWRSAAKADRVRINAYESCKPTGAPYCLQKCRPNSRRRQRQAAHAAYRLLGFRLWRCGRVFY